VSVPSRGLLLGMTVLLTLGSVACGGGSGPVEVPSEEIPFPLERSPATPTPSGGSAVAIYLVRGGRLAGVERTVSAAVSPEEAVMRALLDGPTSEERDQGLTTAVPPATGLIAVGTFEGVAEVDLSDEFQGPATPEDVLLRVAQVVWTLVALPRVNAVRFSIDGEPISVITDAQVMVDRPVTAPDYAAVAPLGSEPIVTQP
jgi:predicted small lipoprotein YifL